MFMKMSIDRRHKVVLDNVGGRLRFTVFVSRHGHWEQLYNGAHVSQLPAVDYAVEDPQYMLQQLRQAHLCLCVLVAMQLSRLRTEFADYVGRLELIAQADGDRLSLTLQELTRQRARVRPQSESRNGKWAKSKTWAGTLSEVPETLQVC